MTAGELCNRTVYIIHPDESILEAARLMKTHHVGCLVVVEERGDERVPVAMLTDRDLVVKGLAEAPRELARLRVAQVMSDGLVTARENERMYDVRKKMRSRGVRRIPVVDAQDRLQGIIAFDDLVDWLAQELADLARLVSRELSKWQIRYRAPWMRSTAEPSYQLSPKGRTSTSNDQADLGCVARWYTVFAMSLGLSWDPSSFA